MLWATCSGIACFSEFNAFYAMPGIGRPGIGDVRQTVDTREKTVMGLYDNFR